MSWRKYFRRKQWDEERSSELAAYVEAETAENVARGMAVGAARTAALKKLGNPTLIREEIYRMNTIGILETILQDLRFGSRAWRKSPGFTLVALLSLALGIGANTAIFSMVHAVLIRPLPYPHAARLVEVDRQEGPDVTMTEFEFWKQHTASFESAAGYRTTADRSLMNGQRQEWIKTLTVTGDFFRTLGIAPALGREFSAEETRPNGPRALVLADGLWRRAFDAAPDVLGRAVTLDNTAFVIVGVLPPGFWFSQTADAFVPLRPTGSMDDRGYNTTMIARLKSTIPLRKAEAESATLVPAIRREHPDLFKSEYRGLTLRPYHSALNGNVRTNLLMLFGAVGLLLLIACSNLAGLLLARLAVRQKEIAMRLALGGSRGRLLRQFLIENLMLTLTGGAAGLATARILLDLLVTYLPFTLLHAAPIPLDGPVLAFTLAVAVATGLALSLAPILRTSRIDLQEMLKAGGRSMSGVRQGARGALVIGEVALSATLLVSAGLLIQSLYHLYHEQLGFTPDGLVTLSTPFAAEHRKTTADQLRYEDVLMASLHSLPGVTSIAAINRLPLAGHANMPAEGDGHPEQSTGGMEIRYVTPQYFETMGIPIRRGRPPLDGDTAAAGPIIVVNDTLARRWWQASDPLGDRIVIGRFRGHDYGVTTARVIVGVVADTKGENLKDPPRPTVYVPLAQREDPLDSIAWLVRARLSPGLATEIRQAVARVDSRQRVLQLRTVEALVASTTADSRFDAWLFGLLAALALGLTAIGVYGILAFSVARRAHEIGTRMALGASPGAVLRLVLKQGVALIAIGLTAGLACAFLVTRSLASLLYGVRPNDPATFAAVGAILLVAGTLASYLPARRATRVDPLIALRDE